MKKIIFTILLAVFALSTTACTMVYADPQYESNYNNEDYAYLDDYAQVNWNDAQYDLEYSYYDMDRVFLVVYGGRIFVIPYDYFYRYIYPRFRMRIIWRSYDYLCGLWGYDYYNNLWGNWYYHHHRSYWRPHFNYYENHRNRNNNRPFVIRRNELQQRYDGTRYQVRPQPRNFMPRNDGTRNYNYIPRNEQRKFEPRSEYPRSFHTPSTPQAHQPSFTPSHSGQRFSAPPPPPVKHDNGEHKR